MPHPAVAVGFDPGLGATGYAVARREEDDILVQESGVIRTRPALPLEVRLSEIYAQARSLLERVQPDLVALEDVYADVRFPKVAQAIGYVRGVLYLVAAHCGVPVASLAPAEVKRAVTGWGKAPKAQVQAAVLRLVNCTDPERTGRDAQSHHAADALALAVVVLRRGVQQMRAR